jgi:hypothetical protein
MVSADDFCKPFDHALRIVPDAALPDNRDSPTAIDKRRRTPPVALNVRLELATPEVGASSRSRCELAVGVPMPEAPMYQDGQSVLRQHDVRTSRQIPAMENVPVTSPVQAPSDCELRLRVAPTDSRHHLTALVR